MNMIGANFTTSIDSITDGRSFGAGNRYVNFDGKEFVFVKATSAIVQNDVVTFDESFSTTVAPISTSNDAKGDKVGVATAAIGSGSYGWLQIYGPCTMNVKASCAANVQLNTTATAGSLDDDATAGSIAITGIHLTAARAASDGPAAGVLNYPVQATTL
jgi:hypothetical protein